jgi:hypothetical protein
MSSSRTTHAALAWALAAACAAGGPAITKLDGKVGVLVELVPSDAVNLDHVEYQWEVVRAPDGSTAVAPHGAANGAFSPDRRGGYVIDRWVRSGITDDLIDEFVISATGAAPHAVATVPGTVPVSVLITLDGTASSSPEARPLTYRWRIHDRPRGSAATLDALTGPTVTLTPDVIGSYQIELEAFDGELWSAPAEAYIQVTH